MQWQSLSWAFTWQQKAVLHQESHYSYDKEQKGELHFLDDREIQGKAKQ